MKTIIKEDGNLLDLVCIGEDLCILKGDSEFIIDRFYVSREGRVVFCISGIDGSCNERSLIRFTEELRFWDYHDLDRIAEDYFYETTGQAALVIDALVEEGLMNYSGKADLAAGINDCLKNQKFLLVNKAGSFILGAEYISSAAEV